MNSIDVDYDGAIHFTQTNGAGTDYWVEPNIGNDYTEVANVAVVNRPTGTDVIALNAGGRKTITFSQAVVDPFLAFTSWNNNTVTFSSPFTVISQGRGF